VLERLQLALQQKSGLILVCGPAGSGKTTTAYACARHLLQSTPSARCLITLEDPIEACLTGAAQSQINTAVGFSWSEGLKAILRQDPEVLLVGEIRDDETARVVFQAAMTGQLVITTMHARSCADALRRLMEMQVPSHHLRGCVDFLGCQRLVSFAGSTMDRVQGADCRPITELASVTGRLLDCELLPSIEGPLAEAVQAGAGSRELQTLIAQLRS
jgi:type II secretory ATPase GspE/PulE/Tfp pilus assembly ATPase PilB-like protein